MNKWKFIKIVLSIFTLVVVYASSFGLLIPRLLSAKSTISFFEGIVFSTILIAFAIYLVIKYLIKILK